MVRTYSRTNFTASDMAGIVFELVRDGFAVLSVRKSKTDWTLHLRKGAIGA